MYRDLKKYIKRSSCYPDRCRKSDYENIMQDFKTSEKVKVLVILEPVHARQVFHISINLINLLISDPFPTSGERGKASIESPVRHESCLRTL